MILKEQIEKLVTNCIEILENKEELFIVDIKVNQGNIIQVFIDSDKSIDISDCVRVSRYIESNLDRETEDYELNVSSYGLDQTIFLPRQFKKHIGRTIRFVLNNQEDFNAELISVNENQLVLKTKPKKKKDISMDRTIIMSDIQKAKLIITF